MIDFSKRLLKGRVDRLPRVLCYGFDGVGKTQFAAGAPDPFFIDANKGSLRFDVERVLVNDWPETRDCLDAVEHGQIKCRTLVLDSLTDLEAMSHKHLFSGSTIDKFEGGYGRGENVSMDEWRTVLAQLERIWSQGKTIVLIAHATVKRFDDPSGPGFDRFEISARPRLAGQLRLWSDYVLFAREEVVTAAPRGQGVKATTTGVRWLYTKRVPAYDAKSRGTMLFPDRILLGWRDFDSAVRGDTAARPEELSREIDAMLVEIADEKLTSQVRTYVKEYPTQVVEARNRVAARLDESRKQKEEKPNG
jgi:AAA domain